ncbi:MAG: hypothetical protein SOT07_04490 [Paludibacteraceae bacterium]|nr:hypothetical protein [Paludibacteraceae bacterium]
MKTRRIVNMVIWALVALVLIALVCVEWHKQGCAWQSLAMGAAWYGALSIGGCVLVDDILKERR